MKVPKYKIKPATQTKTLAGFTIVELIISIVLIGMILPTIVMFLNSINSMNGRANTISTINGFVENKIEAYRSAGFKSIPLTGSPVDYTGAQGLPNNIPRPNSATYNVELADPANPAVKKITILVSFRAFDSTESRSYITYLGELGVGQ